MSQGHWKRGVGAALLALGCSLGAAQQLIEMSDAPLDAAELFDRVTPSIWVVYAGDAQGRPVASGSAVVIAADTLVTNCHVLKDAARVAIRRGDIQLTAQQAEADSEHDLCLLRVAKLQAPAVLLAPEPSLRPGMRVYAVGAPRRLEQTISDGLLSGLRRAQDGSLTMVQTSAPISPGSSGGGLFDAHGRLIGITTSGLKESQNLNFAVPSRWVDALSRRAGRIEWQARVAPSEPLAVVRNVPAPVAPEPRPGSRIEAAPRAPVLPAPAIASRPSPAPVDLPIVTPDDRGPSVAAARWSQIDYLLTDRLTGISRKVVYRADAAAEDSLSYNNGAWVERRDGEVLEIASPIAGEFDSAMPPGGWIRPSRMREGDQWHLQYMGKTDGSGSAELRLDAQVAGAESRLVAGTERRLVRIDYRGYVIRKTLAGVSILATGAYRASAWWSPELSRVVRFTANTRGGASGAAFYIDEELELTAIR
ncbi:trypsin-like peptidase domain-containing protein [Variovorax sp. GT1P44]|uniref:S1C family serine protease n=1 Tax=Variovorax sp. GT1P44 TaxID=3443742 RepID=UPI003F44E22A